MTLNHVALLFQPKPSEASFGKMASTNNGQGLWNAPSSYSKFGNNKEDLSVLISREENKFFAVKPLYILAFLQIIFGLFILIAQVFS